MKRPDLDTLACVNPEGQWFLLTGQDNLTMRKVYGQDRLRFLRCRICGEECSARRGITAGCVGSRWGCTISVARTGA